MTILKIKNPYQKYYSSSYSNEATFLSNKKAVEDIRSRLKEIPFSEDKKVLDVACGTGLLGKSFGTRVYGFDSNQEAIKVAEENGLRVQLADIEQKWNYPNNYFDIVIASHIIEHMVNPDHLILEAKRVLKKNGHLIVITPNLAAWFNRILLLFGFQPFFTEVSTVDKTLGLTFTRKLTPVRNTLGHLRVFTPGALKDILRLHGFKVNKTSSVEFGSFPLLIGFIDKLISKNVSLASTIIIVAEKSETA